MQTAISLQSSFLLATTMKEKLTNTKYHLVWTLDWSEVWFGILRMLKIWWVAEEDTMAKTQWFNQDEDISLNNFLWL